ncbi:MAG: ATP-binding cassette domain-containing protein, partial [Planctomycetia bacterium]|nr:ATP-binding cassette domain-containing protein [Planctomycetia bacterium]
LDVVGLGHRLTHKPRELSGGEMQRAAIARALIAQPKLLLADEPTGNLDQKTGGEILSLLKKLNRDSGLTIVMVTHDPAIARQADHIVRLVEGKVAAAA